MRKYRVCTRFYAVLAIMLVLLFGVSFLVARGRLASAMTALAQKQAERTAIAEEVAALQDELAYAQTDAYIERAARDELGLIYPGEYRYVGSR